MLWSKAALLQADGSTSASEFSFLSPHLHGNALLLCSSGGRNDRPRQPRVPIEERKLRLLVSALIDAANRRAALGQEVAAFMSHVTPPGYWRCAGEAYVSERCLPPETSSQKCSFYSAVQLKHHWLRIKVGMKAQRQRWANCLEH